MVNQKEFDPNKISGSFKRDEIYRRRPITETWDGVYAGKDKPSKSKEDSTPAPEEPKVSEKHLMYYHAFQRLGFFDFPRETGKKPVVLQAGVGHGSTLRAMVTKMEAIQPIGMDISMLALLEAKARGVKQLLRGDILALPFADSSIDGIFEVGVAEHLYTDDPFLGAIVDREGIIESFKELHRVLKPEGRVGFIQPSKHSVQPLSKRFDAMRGKWNMGFQEDFGLNDFCQLVSLGGFKDIRFSILQAPDDFPLELRVGDRILKTYYSITGQHRKAEMTGALFAVVATKKE